MLLPFVLISVMTISVQYFDEEFFKNLHFYSSATNLVVAASYLCMRLFGGALMSWMKIYEMCEITISACVT